LDELEAMRAELLSQSVRLPTDAILGAAHAEGGRSRGDSMLSQLSSVTDAEVAAAVAAAAH